ncbi:hypothetical protein [Brevibacillus dissolubilis]|uniref:hypothetical protein n=1 Tax=Brevibacillus dissolubilis TaxID=1844116 RepID=UPI0011176462|nr:hypothetical protein [Brevibacillus dissolubilis]
MSDNKIMLGKRQILFCREQKIVVEGWNFHVPAGYNIIAGGESQQTDGDTLISLYHDSEKVAQLSLKRHKQDNLTIQAIASDVILEIAAPSRTITLIEKN